MGDEMSGKRQRFAFIYDEALPFSGVGLFMSNSTCGVSRYMDTWTQDFSLPPACARAIKRVHLNICQSEFLF